MISIGLPLAQYRVVQELYPCRDRIWAVVQPLICYPMLSFEQDIYRAMLSTDPMSDILPGYTYNLTSLTRSPHLFRFIGLYNLSLHT